jgi:hypothetical protein
VFSCILKWPNIVLFSFVELEEHDDDDGDGGDIEYVDFLNV